MPVIVILNFELIFLLAFSGYGGSRTNLQTLIKKRLDRLLGKGYDIRLRPDYGGNPYLDNEENEQYIQGGRGVKIFSSYIKL